MATEEPVRNEAIRLHRFFSAWYDGQEDLAIEDFSDAMDPLFTIVEPAGRILTRDAIVAAVKDGFGKGGVRIVVDNFDVAERDSYVVCRYNEVQTSADETTTRISTAVMEPDDGAPGGYRWLTVHETWADS